jgi:predicted nucleic acid-binding protein
VPAYYFDSSALVKRYVAEIGTAWVTGLMDPAAGNLLHVARLAGVEVASAFARRLRSGSLSAVHAAAALTLFRADFRTRFHIVGIRAALVNQAMKLAEGHFLRAYDAVQLAAALQVHRRCLAVGQLLTLISADAELNAAALAEGLLVEDPNRHP